MTAVTAASLVTSRREFLAGAAGLVIGVALPGVAGVIQGEAPGLFAPNAFLRIAPDATRRPLVC